MAQRRMFSKKITETDLFLDMPMSAQCLYFHLNMSADDDGFIGNAKTIRRMIGASEDDLKLLLAKEFLIPFDNGVVVIKDWKIHNYIQKDRYNETIYKDEKSTLIENENKQYQRLDHMDIKCIQNVSSSDTQVRLGKDRLGKDNTTGKSSNTFQSSTDDKTLTDRFESIWKDYPRKEGKKKAFASYKRALKNGVTDEEIMEGLEKYNQYIKKEKTDRKYIAHGSTWFNENRWQDEYDVNSNKGSNEKTWAGSDF